MATIALALLGLAAAPAQPVLATHPPAIDARLNLLVGDWMLPSVSNRIFRQKCAWYGRRAFVLCTSQDQRDGTTAQIVYGYSPLQRRFTYYRFDSRGGSVHQSGFPSGAYGIVFTDERLENDGSARFQTTVNLEDEGLHFTQYRSLEGRGWQRTADFLYVPARQGARRGAKGLTKRPRKTRTP